MRYTTVIWDLDGTLLDTIEDLKNAVNYVLSQFGYPERTTDEMKQFVGNGIRVMLARATPDGENNPYFEEIFSRFKPYYEAHCRVLTAPYAGINEALRTLRNAGCKMAVVTNKIQSAAEDLVSELFPDIPLVIGDSPDVKTKPAPDGVYKALRLLDADPQTACYVGDSNVDYQTACNAGLPCLSVLWGFRTQEQLLACGADTLFSTPEELTHYILHDS